MTPALFFMSRYSLLAPASVVLLTLLSRTSLAQASKASSDPSRSAQHALDSAKSGRCKEALPLLKKAIPQTTDKDLKHGAGLAGGRGALVNNQLDRGGDFFRMFNRAFHNDPEVL